MFKRNKSKLSFFVFFALAHLTVDEVLVYTWEGCAMQNAWSSHITLGNQVTELALTGAVKIVNFPLETPITCEQGWFYQLPRTVFDPSINFLLLSVDSLLWAVVATAIWSRLHRKPLPVLDSSEAAGTTWPPAPKP
jgi:hypothetical protein